LIENPRLSTEPRESKNEFAAKLLPPIVTSRRKAQDLRSDLPVEERGGEVNEDDQAAE
jgi:hypothetical protein